MNNSSPVNDIVGNGQHVFLIEDDDFLREDLKALIEFGGYKVHSFSNALDFLSESLNQGPAVLVLDVRMPGMSGIELQERLVAVGRELPIIFISGESSNQQIVKGLKQGAIDFLIKPFNREDLFSAIAQGIQKDIFNIARQSKRIQLSLLLKQLSPRETQVFHLLAQGFCNSQIVESLGVSLETAKQYKQETMRKLQVKSLSQLIKLSQIM